MGSIERRIEALEAQFEPPEDEDAKLRHTVMSEMVEEYGRLRACWANSGYRGGTPPTPIQPTDPAGDALGYPYTRGELMTFAIRRVLERTVAEIEPEASEEQLDVLVGAWADMFRRRWLAGGLDWDEVEATGPPEPTPPWRGGGFSR